MTEVSRSLVEFKEVFAGDQGRRSGGAWAWAARSGPFQPDPVENPFVKVFPSVFQAPFHIGRGRTSLHGLIK